ncbi:uncharacterized protein LTR77_005991 [Saxophila tyrrhenica]|uniref:ML-like domain-containing protein n=1 Tax=Saxophila tyrrhenica TaxID=1690608 RepID=A0AAV9P9N4_9PEZI|nr:hypothetical protein LTR77_005991 [Saxophila tyrrhenica]
MRFIGARHLPLVVLSALPAGVLGGSILSTDGFSQCINNPTVKVTNLDVTYNKDTRTLDFDVAGISTEKQKVKAALVVSAYGREVYTKDFNPCENDMPEMCPLPDTDFSSHGSQTIPEEYASQIPSIAFSVPDLDGNVKLQLTNVDTGKQVGCVESTVGNGNTLNMPLISYVAAGIAAAALALSALSALAAGGHPGAATSSPSFGEVIHWFQGMAMNGMLSVPYPQVYRSFTTNFAFSTGLVPWGSMQTSIDNFRAKTGGNLTRSSYEYLQHNATLVYDGGNSTGGGAGGLFRRALDTAVLFARDGTDVNVGGQSASIGGGDGGNNSTQSGGTEKDQRFVSGIQAYVEQLSIPSENTFMTVLLIWAIVVAALIVSILLFKVILEGWSMIGKLPKSLESWRRRYWWRLAKAITNLILLLYGVWTLYCVYQFTNGDSWAAKVLAGITLGLFTLVLAWFTWRIWSKAKQSKQMDGDAGRLYEDKETWVKYSLFYDAFKKNYYLFFVPTIVYMFAKGCIIAGGNGHGLTQAAGQLAVEAIMLILLLWTRPYQLKSGRWINIIIHVVRVASVVCILVFVEELGISQTTKTITGVVLIVVQSVLTAVLAILIAVNALIVCIKENPHRKQRKEAEKMNRDLDNLTPLDARNSLLMEPMAQHNTAYKGAAPTVGPFSDPKGRYDPVPPRPASPAFTESTTYTRQPRFRREESRDNLVSSAASMGRRDRSVSVSTSPPDRQPTLPALDFGFDNHGHAR